LDRLYEIRFHGRGGRRLTASSSSPKLLMEEADSELPAFGPERAGSL
jgi:hypothetical protein